VVRSPTLVNGIGARGGAPQGEDQCQIIAGTALKPGSTSNGDPSVLRHDRA
jgi:hypothetical protein